MRYLMTKIVTEIFLSVVFLGMRRVFIKSLLGDERNYVKYAIKNDIIDTNRSTLRLMNGFHIPYCYSIGILWNSIAYKYRSISGDGRVL